MARCIGNVSRSRTSGAYALAGAYYLPIELLAAQIILVSVARSHSPDLALVKLNAKPKSHDGHIGCRRSFDRLRHCADMLHRAALLASYHSVVKTIVGQSLVAFDSCVMQRGILITTECEDRLIHLLGVEHLELHK